MVGLLSAARAAVDVDRQRRTCVRATRCGGIHVGAVLCVEEALVAEAEREASDELTCVLRAHAAQSARRLGAAKMVCIVLMVSCRGNSQSRI